MKKRAILTAYKQCVKKFIYFFTTRQSAQPAGYTAILTSLIIMIFDAARANKVDLIVLPSFIDGTNCGNCDHFDELTDFCDHPKVKMNVDERMCCYYWGRKDAWINQIPIFSNTALAFILPRQRVQDIDTPEDWNHAELIFKNFNATL